MLRLADDLFLPRLYHLLRGRQPQQSPHRHRHHLSTAGRPDGVVVHGALLYQETDFR